MAGLNSRKYEIIHNKEEITNILIKRLECDEEFGNIIHDLLKTYNILMYDEYGNIRPFNDILLDIKNVLLKIKGYIKKGIYSERDYEVQVVFLLTGLIGMRRFHEFREMLEV